MDKVDNKKGKELIEAINSLNPILKENGMCEFRVVNPRDCKAQETNARYMPSEVFNQLVENLRKDNRLESVPLCYEDAKGIIRIISGHHRIKAAEEAHLEHIIVMLAIPSTQDEIVSKQLGHNAITGKDDVQTLQDLFNSIQDISFRIASGLADDIPAINYVSLNFKVGGFKEFVLAFIDEDITKYDEKMEKFATESSIKGSSSVRIVPNECYNKFGEILRKIKKVENIKSTSTGFMRMLELAEKQIEIEYVQH